MQLDDRPMAHELREGRRAAGDHQGCDLAQLIAAACGPRPDAKHTAGAGLRDRVDNGYGGQGRAGHSRLDTVPDPASHCAAGRGRAPAAGLGSTNDGTTPDSPARQANDVRVSRRQLGVQYSGVRHPAGS